MRTKLVVIQACHKNHCCHRDITPDRMRCVVRLKSKTSELVWLTSLVEHVCLWYEIALSLSLSLSLSIVFCRQKSKFIPPYGSSTNLRVSSTHTSEDVIKLLMLKFNVSVCKEEFISTDTNSWSLNTVDAAWSACLSFLPLFPSMVQSSCVFSSLPCFCTFYMSIPTWNKVLQELFPPRFCYLWGGCVEG